MKRLEDIAVVDKPSEDGRQIHGNVFVKEALIKCVKFAEAFCETFF